MPCRPRQRAAIVLTYQEGLGNAEAAAVLDTSVSGVETLLVRAKRALRAALANRIRPEEERMTTDHELEAALRRVMAPERATDRCGGGRADRRERLAVRAAAAAEARVRLVAGRS